MTNAEIALLTGRMLGTVRNRRSQFAPGTDGGALQGGVDWSMSDEELAAIHGRAARTVYLRRIAFHPEGRLRPSSTQWEAVDWSLGNVEIARLLEISRQAVHLRRERCWKVTVESLDPSPRKGGA